MTTSALTELAAYARGHAGSVGERMAVFVSAYFDSADPAEIAARGSATLFAIANAHWRLLDVLKGIKIEMKK